MTDRIHSLQVVLEKDLREEDAQVLCDAVSQMRGVQAVTGLVGDVGATMAKIRAGTSVRERLIEIARTFEVEV